MAMGLDRLLPSAFITIHLKYAGLKECFYMYLTGKVH